MFFLKSVVFPSLLLTNIFFFSDYLNTSPTPPHSDYLSTQVISSSHLLNYPLTPQQLVITENHNILLNDWSRKLLPSKPNVIAYVKWECKPGLGEGGLIMEN